MTPTFADAPHFPNVPPPGEQPLNPPLPTPPILFLGGQAFVLERVVIDELLTRRERLGLRLSHVAWCGPLGWVSVEVPR